MSVKKLCRYLEHERMPLLITIIGTMGSGKTTIAKKLYEYCYAGKGFKLYPNEEFNSLDIEDIEKLPKREKYYLLFDDYSYKVTGRTLKDREKLNTVFRVRHILESNDIVMSFVVHYLRSLAVFLRSSQVRILTSINEAEINMYASDYLFTVSGLWDYLYYRRKYRDRYIVLISSSNGEHIVDVTEGSP